MNFNAIIIKIQEELSTIMSNYNVPGHDLDHFITVKNHVINALQYEDLPELTKQKVILAGLLHDIDDHKIFNTTNYENARNILNKYMNNSDIEDIIEMISLVSCSKNGSSDNKDKWKLIPRDCDRLEAIGEIGIERAYTYTIHVSRPLHCEDTIRAYNINDINKAATIERYNNYMKGAKSVSMIDHFYDKLLHIGKPDNLKSDNIYILQEAEKRNKIMQDYVINYWNSLK